MVIVITGATSGIGRAITDILANKKNKLALCARTESDLDELRQNLINKSSCEHVMVRKVNVRHREELKRFAREIHNEYEQVDVLINNAGIYIPGSISNEEEATFDAVLETNLHSAYFLTKALLPKMLKRESGHIINLCSVASIKGYPNGGSYGISKHALLGFGRTLREEVRGYNIRVTNVLPGATWTNSWQGIDLPEDRLMNPKNVAQVVLTAIELDANAVIEDIVMRPVLGDL